MESNISLRSKILKALGFLGLIGMMILMSWVIYFMIFVYTPNEYHKIYSEGPVIGTIINLDKHTDLRCMGVPPGTEGKEVQTYIFLKFGKVIGSEQLVPYYFTLRNKQTVDFGYKKYQFNGYENGQFIFDEITDEKGE